MKKILTLTILLFIYQSTQAQTYTETDKILPLDRSRYNQFGGTLAISGNVAIVGAPQHQTNVIGMDTLLGAGAAYILEKNNVGDWVEVQKLVSPNRETYDFFAHAVAIDGNYAAIGVFDNYDSTNLASSYLKDAGAVYVFERNPSTGQWTVAQKVVSPDRSWEDRFGTMSIEMQGDYLFIAAVNEDHDANGGNFKSSAGAVYIYKRNSSGVWILRQKITPQNRHTEDRFGSSIAVSGLYMTVGAPQQDYDETNLPNFVRQDAGAAYIYKLDIVTEQWNFVQKIASSARDVDDYFGVSIAMDGDYLVVGASGQNYDENNLNPQTETGAIYIFERIGTAPTEWVEVIKKVASDRQVQDFYGDALAIQGNRIAVGVHRQDRDVSGGATMNSAGAVYVLERNNLGNWLEIEKVVASDRSLNAQYGIDLEFAGIDLLVGAHYEQNDANGSNPTFQAGAVYCLRDCPAAVSNTISVTACNSYTAPSGNYIWTSSNTYQDTIRNPLGCDSILTINLTIQPIDTAVTINNNTISSNNTIGTYQWIDCSNNTPILGANNRNFTPSINGNYAVVVTNNGCSDTSACYPVILVDTRIIGEATDIRLFPNPTEGNLSIDLGQFYSSSNIQIINTTGQVIYNQFYENTQQVQLELNQLPKSIYFIQIQTSAGHPSLFKLIKK